MPRNSFPERYARLSAVLERVHVELTVVSVRPEDTIRRLAAYVGESLARDAAGLPDVCAAQYSEFARCDRTRGHHGPCSGSLPAADAMATGLVVAREGLEGVNQR